MLTPEQIKSFRSQYELDTTSIAIPSKQERKDIFAQQSNLARPLAGLLFTLFMLSLWRLEQSPGPA